MAACFVLSLDSRCDVPPWKRVGSDGLGVGGKILHASLVSLLVVLLDGHFEQPAQIAGLSVGLFH